MFDNQLQALARIIKDEDIKNYAGEEFYNLIKAVVFCDAGAGVDAIKNVKDILFHMPTVLFWDKMKRFIYGTFRCYEDQVKFAAKFENDNTKYCEFVKKQVAVVNSIDEDEKIDYFARLTRCYLLCEIDNALYFKLIYLIKNCTVDELKYLENRNITDKSDNNLWVSVLSLQGLFVQEQSDNGNTYYVLSDIGKCLKSYCLNFCDGMNIIKKKYSELEALPQMEPMSWQAIDETLVVSGGNRR